MRDLLYKKKTSYKSKRKVISLGERFEDNKCKTHVRKSFVYMLNPEMTMHPKLSEPELIIKKFYDSKRKEEKFLFRVKGYFYIRRNRCLFRVNFLHALNIHIQWKTKIPSSQSATLT